MGKRYLSYDIKGIQSFIFSIPKLKYIVGASALIDEFDRKTAKGFEMIEGVRHLFSGGGRGAFSCAGEVSEQQLLEGLLRALHELGLDVRIGTGDTFAAAAHGADRLFPYIPKKMAGHPCPVSGQYPTDASEHEVVALRRDMKDAIGIEVAGDLRTALEERGGLPEEFLDCEWSFPLDVDEETEEGRAGGNAIGGRNRWAVVAMDGNDMGRQHREMADRKIGEEAHVAWLSRMSKDLDDATREAFVAAVADVVARWVRRDRTTPDGRKVPEWRSARQDGKVFLPVRPLVLGGDDALLLCHPGFAMSLARDLARSFEELSGKKAEDAKEDGFEELWPATGGRLTISAGILYTKVSYPLHSAITYAESLLASAKGRFRDAARKGEPAPAAVDFEHVTDGLLDTPAERRRRTLRFLDEDTGEIVSLTGRPYTFEDLDEVYAGLYREIGERSVPRSLLQSVVPGLRGGFFDRFAFRAGIEKNHPWLAGWLAEPEKGDIGFGPGWRRVIREGGPPERETVVPDVLTILEEQHRLTQRRKGGER
ncbi:MAG: hypothetical protein GF328_10275 [Candidatus Latescibacteria bacterium]|nr:hypothetical protein [Candidatus Latescibacterota bacterium]